MIQADALTETSTLTGKWDLGRARQRRRSRPGGALVIWWMGEDLLVARRLNALLIHKPYS